MKWTLGTKALALLLGTAVALSGAGCNNDKNKEKEGNKEAAQDDGKKDGKDKNKEGDRKESRESAKAGKEDPKDHKHGSKEGEKAAAKEGEKGKHGDWWCQEHGVPEHLCSLCLPDDEVQKKFKDKGDWCKLHDRAKSQCFKCNPKAYDKFAAMYRAMYGKEPPRPAKEEFEK